MYPLVRTTLAAVAVAASPVTAGCELLVASDEPAPTTTEPSPTQFLAVQFTERCRWRIEGVDGTGRSSGETVEVRRMSVVAPRRASVGERITVTVEEADRDAPLPGEDLGHVGRLDVTHHYGGNAAFAPVGLRSLGGVPRGERIPPDRVVHRTIGAAFTPASVEVDLVANGDVTGVVPLPFLGGGTGDGEGSTTVRAATEAGVATAHCRPDEPGGLGFVEVVAPTSGG